ncbi:HipA family kinase [Paenibacillus sp. FSL K6-0276]|uniref:HipA family kinase n=1 Tax=Paenibacillus sp. FSL K6-0276 TaxID=2921450 RepID=UPI0030ED054B
MNVINAVRPMQPVNNGVTKPYVILCDDGNQYYTKFKQNPEGTRVLANEYVCAKLADQLKLPLANPTLINIDKEFIKLYGTTISNHIECGEELSGGLHFGTKKINKAFQIANSKMLESATNIRVIPEIILFDQLICNTDRDCNGGNLIFDQSNMQLVVIDHTHVFEIGSLWNANQLNLRIGSRFEPFTQNGYIFRKLVPFVNGHNPFDPILGKMSGITDAFLWNTINGIPDEWTIPSDDKTALHSYLGDRLHRINDALHILKPLLPHWKGGT